MKKKKVEKKINIRNLGRELKEVDTLFANLGKDKTLPTFVDHVALCIVLGTSENVNLKAMYPAVHKKIYTFLLRHNSKIMAIGK